MKGLRKNKERVLGFALAFVMVVSVIVGGNVCEVKAEASSRTLIDSVTLEFDWKKFKVSELEPSSENYEFWVTMTGTGVKQTEDPDRYIMVKPTQAHVEAGYISSDVLESAGDNGWVSYWLYGSGYKIGANDEIGYDLRIHAEDGYSFSDATSIQLKGDNVTLESKTIQDSPFYDDGNNAYLTVTLNLGTGADIEEAINPSIQEPVTPPTTDSDEVVFTDETADAILGKNEVVVICTCKGITESTESDPYAWPVRVIKNADGTESYEPANSDDAEKYIRIDYDYKFTDEAKLTWLENYKDAQHPNSMYDKSYPIVLQDAEGNIYVKTSTFGMAEGSWDEQINVVPKEIYDGYMDWLINKLKGEVSDTTTNDHKAQLENESDVKTKVELTQDEKSAIASGEELEVVLVFTDAGTKADNEEKKAIEKELGSNKLGTFLDIELIKKIGSTEVSVSETTGLISITFEMPEALKNTDKNMVRTYKIMRYHDGKVDILDANYDEKTGFLTFETDKFSTYAVVYSEAKANTTTNTAITPQTGDTSNTVLYVAMLCLAMYAVTVVLRKQRLEK